MKTVDEILKMRAAVLYVLQAFPEGVDYIKLFKILYFAQREHLVKYGRGVIGDTFHALKYGPVPSFIYKSLQMLEGRVEHEKDLEVFCEGIRVDEHAVVSAVDEPDMDELSVSDVRCLDKSIKKYRDVDSYRLSRRSHDVAWKEAYSRALDDPEKDRMTWLDIAKAGRATSGVLEYIKENIQIDKYLN